jgi:hypothetical protein
MLQRILLAALLAVTAAGCSETTYEFEDVGVGGDDADGRTPRERSNSQFVRSAYADLLGRTPESYEFSVSLNGAPALSFRIDEQAVLMNALDAVGDVRPVRSLIISGLLASVEVDIPAKADVDDPEQYIRDQFRFFLGREPGVYELAAFADEWDRSPAVNPRTVIRALMESREYQTY